MSSRLVSFAAKGLVASVVAIVQVVLLGVMSLNRPMQTPDSGGAPVINLSLQPMVAFDGHDGAEEAVEAIDDDTPPEPASARTAEITTRVALRADAPSELVVRSSEPSSPVDLVELASGAALSMTPLTSSAAGSIASASSRSGLTQGGGGEAVGASGGRSTDNYEAEILRWIESHKGSASGNLGVVTIGFTLDRRGRLSGERIVRTSGRAGLDAFTLRKIRQAAPFPRPSSAATWSRRDFVVNVDYRNRT